LEPLSEGPRAGGIEWRKRPRAIRGRSDAGGKLNEKDESQPEKGGERERPFNARRGEERQPIHCTGKASE